MDAQAIVAALEAARSFTVEVAGAAFTVRRPTIDAFYAWCKEHRNGETVDYNAMMAAHLPGCIFGWSGVTLRHYGGETAAPVEYSAAAVDALLADNKTVQIALWTNLIERVNERVSAMGDDAKNSSRVSAPV